MRLSLCCVLRVQALVLGEFDAFLARQRGAGRQLSMTGQCRTLATPHLHVNPRACAFPVAFTPDPSRTSQPHQRTLVLHPALVTLHTLPRFPAFNRSFGVPSVCYPRALPRPCHRLDPAIVPSCRRAIVPPSAFAGWLPNGVNQAFFEWQTATGWDTVFARNADV